MATLVRLDVARSRRERGLRVMRRCVGLRASVAAQLGYIVEAWLVGSSPVKNETGDRVDDVGRRCWTTMLDDDGKSSTSIVARYRPPKKVWKVAATPARTTPPESGTAPTLEPLNL